MSALDRTTPSLRQLMAALGHPLPPEETDTPVPVDCGLVAVTFTFQTLITITVPIRCDSPNLGLQLATCAARSRAFIQGIAPGSACAKIRDWKRKYRCAYLVKIDGQPVFSLSDAARLLSKSRDTAPSSATPHLTLVVAPDTPPSKADAAPGTPQLRLDQFCTVIHALYELGKALVCLMIILRLMVISSPWSAP
jgi:hypothetical protein